MVVIGLQITDIYLLGGNWIVREEVPHHLKEL
jgi:hypothetical protein